jgi:glycosyltransferase involved in cell wall biosynthesis
MKISATIITLNEERNIERCIRSLDGVADEIIVLDSFSNDRTEEICGSLNVRFEKRKWEGYAASKNYLNSMASYQFILSIDADEALDEALKCRIIQLKNAKTNYSSTVFNVNRLTNYCGKWIYHSGWYPDLKTRIFPKKTCHWEGAYVHEELICSEKMNEIQLIGHLEHYSYYSFEEHRIRADKYSALTAQKMHAKGKKAGFFKPYISAIGRFVAMYFINKGFLDGYMGYKIAQISALSNIFKYNELRRLNKGGN